MKPKLRAGSWYVYFWYSGATRSLNLSTYAEATGQPVHLVKGEPGQRCIAGAVAWKQRLIDDAETNVAPSTDATNRRHKDYARRLPPWTIGADEVRRIQEARQP